jgi:phage-related protein
VKPLVFLGNSRDDLRMFSDTAKRKTGFQLRRLQRGVEPEDWKPMKTIGAGVLEIRVRDDIGAWRVVCVAKLADAVYVLHAFQKRTQATPKREIDLAAVRFKELMRSK